MHGPIIFLDTETTGLSLDDDIWEFAAIRREPDGTETELHLFIEHADYKCRKLPANFLADHEARWDADEAWHPKDAAWEIYKFTNRDAPFTIAGASSPRPHIIGAVPNFDTERLTILLSRYGFTPGWHHHLIDVEPLAIGWLAAKGTRTDIPWNSNDLSRAVGVEPPTDTRHTAMGDARWCRDLYDAITRGH